MTKKRTKPNVSQLSRELGISRSTLHRWAREGMNLADKRAVLLRAAEVAGKAGDRDAMRDAKIAYWVAKAEREQLAAKREAGAVIPREGLFDQARAAAIMWRQRVEGLRNTLPPKLAGLESAEMVRPLDAELREVCQGIADDLGRFVEDLTKGKR